MRLDSTGVLSWWKTAAEAQDSLAACSGKLACDVIIAVEEYAGSGSRQFCFTLVANPFTPTSSFKQRRSSKAANRAGDGVRTVFACETSEERSRWVEEVNKYVASKYHEVDDVAGGASLLAPRWQTSPHSASSKW